MADYGTFKFGAVTFPVPASPLVRSLEALDPPVHAALAFYKAMLEKHLGAYFDAIVTSAGLADYAGKIVAEAIGYDPAPYLTTAQYKFPLLAIYRTEEEPSEHTANWFKSASAWTVLYVLPPLTAAQAAQVVHILKGVRAVVLDRTEQGYDPDYLAGALVWEAAGVMKIGVSRVRYGTVPSFDAKLYFPAVELTIAVEEREQKNPDLVELEGLDGEVATSNGTPADDQTVAEIAWENVTP